MTDKLSDDQAMQFLDEIEQLVFRRTPHEWTCGHVAGSMCVECYRELAHKAGLLAEEGRLLREELLIVTQERDEAWAKIDQLLGRTP